MPYRLALAAAFATFLGACGHLQKQAVEPLPLDQVLTEVRQSILDSNATAAVEADRKCKSLEGAQPEKYEDCKSSVKLGMWITDITLVLDVARSSSSGGSLSVAIPIPPLTSLSGSVNGTSERSMRNTITVNIQNPLTISSQTIQGIREGKLNAPRTSPIPTTPSGATIQGRPRNDLANQ